MYTKDKQPSKLRLVLRAINSGSASSFRPAQWVYIQLPAMQGASASSTLRAVSRGWHPFSLAAQESSTLELLIDVHPPVGSQRVQRFPCPHVPTAPLTSLSLTPFLFTNNALRWYSRWAANLPGPGPSSCTCAT